MCTNILIVLMEIISYSFNIESLEEEIININHPYRVNRFGPNQFPNQFWGNRFGTGLGQTNLGIGLVWFIEVSEPTKDEND